MRIRFLANTNIRTSPNDFSKPPLGVIFSGVELDVEDRLYKGKPLEGVDTYFRDNQGWFYWSGRVVILYKALEGPKVRKKESGLEPENIGGSWQFQLGQSDEAPELEKRKVTPLPATSPPEEMEDGNNSVARGLSGSPPQGTKARILPEFAPDIESLPLNWGLESLGIPDYFWRERNLFGKGVRIAMLGAGIEESHPGLEDVVEKGRSFCGGNPSDFRDENGEGTAFALLVAGRGINTVTGVAPAARLLAGKVMSNYLSINCSHFLEAFQWAIEEEVDIIMSNIDFRENLLSRDQRNQLSDLFGRAAEKGVFCLAPAGRSKNIRPENRFPAALSTCLSVGAYAENGERAPNSIRSYALDVVSPGDGLVKALGFAGQEAVGAAAAFTAGGIALLLEWLRRNNRKIEPKTLIRVVRDTAVARYPNIKCRDIEYGCGYFQPAKVLEYLERNPSM